MYANYEISMPQKYVDLSENEMEYEGSGFWGGVFGGIAGIVAPVAGAIVTGVTAAAIGAVLVTPVGAAAAISLIAIGGVTGYYALPF